MSERPAAILERFPLHLGATDPGKRLGAVVVALAADLDVLALQLSDVRAAHRVGAAPTLRDLLGLAALHRLDGSALALLDRRVAAARAAAAATPPQETLLAGLLALPPAVVAALAGHGDDLAAAMSGLGRHRGRLELQRGVVLGVVRAHTAGNATPAALLIAAGAYLGLDVNAVRHTAGGWWHLASCRELLRLVPPDPPPEAPPVPPPDLTPVPDVLALEENPFRRADLDAVPKRLAQRTRILRSGLADVDVTVRVVGVGDRTVRPMVVHLGSGRGIAFEGTVPDGAELDFGAGGRVTLGGADVTGSAWSFAGAVFADATQVLPGEDFAFTAPDGTVPAPDDAAVTGGGPRAARPGVPGRFAVAAPLDAFAEVPPFPHGAAAVGPLTLPRGESRWTCLVRVARLGRDAGEAVVPYPMAGRFDGSVFAAAPAQAVEPSMLLGFVWEEREPFAVRILLPRRFAAVDDDAGTLLLQPLTGLLDRHRAAGVHLRAEYADPRWTLGQGVVRGESGDALGVVLAGTELWPDGTPQPDRP